jgi:DNA-binding GntR family transcriptional regulator
MPSRPIKRGDGHGCIFCDRGTDRREKQCALYQQLADILKRNINGGILKLEELIPTEQQICDRFKMSHSTVRRAIKELETDGLIIRIKGRGTFIKQ